MEKVDIRSSAIIYDSIEELAKEDRILMEAAILATKDSYSPYSSFKVGAALLLDNGKLVTGSNQENAAYPSGMCAERVAVWKAGSSYPKSKILKLAISANSPKTIVDKPVGPCGACRQSLLEYEVNQKQPLEIFFMGEVGQVVQVESVEATLPFSFDSSYLP